MFIYIILIIPAVLLSLYAQFKVQSTFKKYLSVKNGFGITGADAARKILNENNLNNIEIEEIEGELTDHYDPRTKTVRLSKNVYSGTSVSALGVAAHETGHAIQHNSGYLPLNIRSALVPIATFGSWAALPIIFIGFFLQSIGLIGFGIIVFSLIVAFQVVTLPVEFNASKRALAILGRDILTSDELKDTKKVLNAAALTYVAAATVALAELLRYILLFTSLKGEDE